MAPKRKRANEAPATETSPKATRATRSAAKSNGKEDAASKSKKVATKGAKAKQAEPIEVSDGGSDADAPVVKKTKVASTRGKGAAKKKGQSDDPAPSSSKAPDKKHTNGVNGAAASPVQTAKGEPYDPARALSLFTTYADPDTPDEITAEGFEKLCNDGEIPIDGAMPMILSWQLGAKEMLKITKEEWTKGTSSLKISSLPPLLTMLSDMENLVVQGKPPLARPTAAKKKDEPYNRNTYFDYAADQKAAFQKFYSYCFNLAKPEQSRNMEMETSVAFWSIILAPQYPIMDEVIAFINEKGTYKATNKDLWNMMLEFCQTVKPTLQGYDAGDAWPTLLDDFVSWKQGQTSQE